MIITKDKEGLLVRAPTLMEKAWVLLVGTPTLMEKVWVLLVGTPTTGGEGLRNHI